MRIRSAPGKGTTVLVRLPVAPTQRLQPDPSAIGPSEPRGPRQRDDRQGSLPGI
jgi:hypothetical protein